MLAVIVKGGTIAITGIQSNGVQAKNESTTGTGLTATAVINGGSITTDGKSGHGVFARFNNNNDESVATVNITNGTINTKGESSEGAYALHNGNKAKTIAPCLMVAFLP